VTPIKVSPPPGPGGRDVRTGVRREMIREIAYDRGGYDYQDYWRGGITSIGRNPGCSPA